MSKVAKTTSFKKAWQTKLAFARFEGGLPPLSAAAVRTVTLSS